MKQETITEFADRCRECGSMIGRRMKKMCFDGMTNGEVIDLLFPNTDIYNNRDFMLREMIFSDEWWDAPFSENSESQQKMIDALGTVNLAHWIDNRNGTISCSRCHTWFHKDDRYSYMHYCPCCNAKMIESEEINGIYAVDLLYSG